MRPIKFREWNMMSRNMSFPASIRLPWEQKRDGIYLMQFTGLLDRHGKEIYEGDVVKHHQGVDKIHWNIDGWRVGNWQPSYLGDFTCEIIGNIYENPELLN